MRNSQVAFAGVFLIAAVPVYGQGARTGVAHPDAVIMMGSGQDFEPVAAPATATGTKPSADGPVVQASGAGAATTSSEVGRRGLAMALGSPEIDPDAGIVTYVPWRAGEIAEGSLLKVRLRQPLSTLTTRPGTAFTAEMTEPVMQDGRVILPEDSILEGRVTIVHGGHRVGDSAAMHLEAKTITFPDGTRYVIHARVIDTDRWKNTKVDSEGTILRKDNAKGTSAALGLAAGGGAAAGAMVAGVPGALVGAGLGAGVGTVVWMREDREADLPKDLVVVFSLTAPMRVGAGATGLAAE